MRRNNLVKRTQRGSIKIDQVLMKLREGRKGAIQVCTEAKVDSEEYRAAGEVTQSIDKLAEKLTGNVEYFWGKPHG